jgi:hypothetical protein
VNHINTALERNVHAHAEAGDGEVEIFAKIANERSGLKATSLEQIGVCARRLLEKRKPGQPINLDPVHQLGKRLAFSPQTDYGNGTAGGGEGVTFISDPGIVRKEVFHEH